MVGTSGGSIVAGMLAIKTDEEMLKWVCTPSVSTDYFQDGSQAKAGIAWFPPLMTQIYYFVRNGVLCDNAEFERTTAFFYGDTTFGEAFALTGRHVCIGVSASRLPEDRLNRRTRDTTHAATPKRLLCSHVSTPHVLVRRYVSRHVSNLAKILPIGT